MLVAVSGATGFLGSYLLPLLAASHEVVALTRAEKPPLASPGVRWITKVDYAQAESVLPPDTQAVIHLAAVMPGPHTPPEACWFNLASTLELLRALRRTKGRRLVLASTQMVYGPLDAMPVDERALCLPNTPYGLSKLAAEAFSLEQGPPGGVEVVCLRLAELFGLGQERGYARDVILSRALKAQDIVLFGHYKQLHDLLYVRDAARAVVLALETNAQGAFNIGAGRPHSLEEYARTCVEVIGQGRCKVEYAPEQPTQGTAPPDFWMDPNLARQQLGFQAQFDLPSAMEDILTSAQGRQGR